MDAKEKSDADATKPKLGFAEQRLQKLKAARAGQAQQETASAGPVRGGAAGAPAEPSRSKRKPSSTMRGVGGPDAESESEEMDLLELETTKPHPRGADSPHADFGAASTVPVDLSEADENLTLPPDDLPNFDDLSRQDPSIPKATMEVASPIGEADSHEITSPAAPSLITSADSYTPGSAKPPPPRFEPRQQTYVVPRSPKGNPLLLVLWVAAVSALGIAAYLLFFG